MAVYPHGVSVPSRARVKHRWSGTDDNIKSDWIDRIDPATG